MAAATLVSIDDFLDLPESPVVTRELLHGRVIEMGAPSPLHGAIQALTAHLLIAAIDELGLPLVVGTHSGFILPESVLAPDVYAISQDSFHQLPSHRGALRGVPALAVEVVSPSENAADIEEKVAAYLAAGVRTVWVLFPGTRTAWIHHSTGDSRRVTMNGVLDAPASLPGVIIPVASVFRNVL